MTTDKETKFQHNRTEQRTEISEKKNTKLWFSVSFVIIKKHCIPSALQLGRKKGNKNDLPDQRE